MKTKPNDGGPVYPQPGLPYFRDGIPQNPHEGYGWAVDPIPGMTLRQYYIGKAIAGCAARPDNRTCPKSMADRVEEWRAECYRHDAQDCIRLADALIAELEKEGE